MLMLQTMPTWCKARPSILSVHTRAARYSVNHPIKKKTAPSQPGYYISKLPLLPDYKNHMSSNYDGVDQANIKMLQQLQKTPGDAEEVSKSYNELIKNKFIIPLKELPQDQQDYITNNPIQHYIPNAVAYKGDSHSPRSESVGMQQEEQGLALLSTHSLCVAPQPTL